MARRMLSRLEDTLAREGRSARGGRGLRASAGSPIRHNSCLDFCTRVRSSAACSMACHNQPDTHTIKSWRKTIDQDGRVRGSDHRSLEWHQILHTSRFSRSLHSSTSSQNSRMSSAPEPVRQMIQRDVQRGSERKETGKRAATSRDSVVPA